MLTVTKANLQTSEVEEQKWRLEEMGTIQEEEDVVEGAVSLQGEVDGAGEVPAHLLVAVVGEVHGEEDLETCNTTT